jgi:hypothetical protein
VPGLVPATIFSEFFLSFADGMSYRQERQNPGVLPLFVDVSRVYRLTFRLRAMRPIMPEPKSNKEAGTGASGTPIGPKLPRAKR